MVVAGLVVSMLLVAQPMMSGFAQLSAPNAVGNSTTATAPATTLGEDKRTQLYGCELVDRTVHCDPAPNKLESHVVRGSTERLHTVTKDAMDMQFAEGAGNSAGALQFNAFFGEFVNIENNAKLNPSQFSVSFWLKRDPDQDYHNYGHVISHIDALRTSGWLFDVGNTTSQSIRFGVTNSNGTVFYTNSVPIVSNEFTHIVGTFDGSSVKVYRNGVLHSTVPYSGVYSPDPGYPIKIAMTSYNFGASWEGVIDELRIYNKPLTEQETSSLFANSANGLINADDTLVGHWPFDIDAADASVNVNPTNYIIQTAGMAFTPDGRLLFTEKNTGKIRVMLTAQNDTVLEEPFAVVPDLHHDMEQGLLGVAVDPEFELNHQVYVYYTAKEGNATATPFNRVVRFTDVDSTGIGMEIIIDKIPAHAGGMHAGGAIAFGPHDGKLYINVGDAYEPAAAQDSTSLLGKVLRINKDGSTPLDNPIPNSPVYTMGHRNHYGIAFDNAGNGIVTENGEDLYDEINFLVEGGNYGFPVAQPPDTPPELAVGEEAGTDSIKPIRSYWKTIAPTQAIHYDGGKFPELQDRFLVGSYNNGRLYALDINENNQTLSQELKIEFPSRIASNIIAVAQSPLTGDIYYGAYYIYKLQSFDMDSREPILGNVQVTYPSTYLEVTGLQFDPSSKTLAIKFASTSDGILPDISDPFELVAEIPKLVLDGITSVSVHTAGNGGLGNASPLEFSITNSTGANNILAITGIPVIEGNQPVGEFQLSIVGSITRFGGG